MNRFLKAFFSCCVLALVFCLNCYANNLTISNVTLEDRNPSNGTVVVEFDVSWENSWRTKINHDALWVTFRLFDPTVLPTNKKICQLFSNGLNPEGTSVGSNLDLDVYVPSDKLGLLIRPNSYGKSTNVFSENVRVTLDFSSCGFSATDNVKVSTFGLEMVYVPEGAFYAGDENTSTAALMEGSSDDDAWYLYSEEAIGVSNVESNGYRYVSAGNSGEDVTGAAFTLGKDYPKGFKSFYMMKYEITEGQWVEFFNSLSVAARNNLDLTDGNHKNTDLASNRNVIACSGTPLVCITDRPARAVSYLEWMDLAAFLDWAALRPMTELEFEKAARGPLLSVAGEYAWGSTNIVAAASLTSGDELGNETITNVGANANYDNITFSGGDASYGTDYSTGSLRAGIFATVDSDRESSGAGYYGALELSGNVRERVVTIGNVFGRSFVGSHGDGILSSTFGFEGNATNEDWPGINDTVLNGITGADGSGFKGGSWNDQISGARLRISDRHNAANADTASYADAGGRGVRSYDGE